MNLVIVESPAKCKKIAEFLGPTYKVVATMGHIRALEEDIEAVGIDRDFEPRFKFIKEKTKAMKAILDAAESAKTIYLAADDDREGEAIAYSVACLLKRDALSFPRAVFHEITKKAVCDSIANPRKINMNKVYAQQARSVLDMLVGFTISPLLWKHVARGLSAGRCQTPALRLVYERENSIKSHNTSTSWNVSGTFKGNSEFQAKLEDELEDQESAMNYLENIHKEASAKIVSVSVKPWTANPPPPLITSTLQQEVSALHKINPKTTMKIAQALYEAGHITYMRTDHAILSEDAVKEAHAWVKAEYGDEYVGPLAKKKLASASNAQEAHEAIRPTHMEVKDLPGDWSPADKKIYFLIWKRATQSTMSAANGKTRIVKMTFADDADFIWSAQWKKTDFPGWQVLGQTAKLDSDDEEEEDSSWKDSDDLKAGMFVKWNNIKSTPKMSKASSRFTEATLIRDLEKRGIGRPSTFASLVETLVDKEYVEKKDIPGEKAVQTTMIIKPMQWPPLTQSTQIITGAEKQKLVPTLLGESVIKFCIREFPCLFAYDFTAQMESRLDSISQGNAEWKELCRSTWMSYKEQYDKLKDKASLPTEKVKDFGNGFKAVMSKKGPLLVQESNADAKPTFYTFPPDITFLEITEEIARNWINNLANPAAFATYEEKAIIKKKGPYGEYLEWDGAKIPYDSANTLEEIIEKLKAAKKVSNVRVGQYIFAIGKYGPYMYKDIVKKKFVSIPSTINTKTITEAEAAALYKNGLEAKEARSGFRKRDKT